MSASGIVLVLIGLLFIAMSMASQSKVEYEEVNYVGRDKDPSWEVEGYFEKGEYLVVDYRYGFNWTMLPVPAMSNLYPGVDLVLVFFNISGPDGNVSWFGEYLGILKGMLVRMPNGTKFVDELSNDGLIVSSPLDEIGGITKHSGLYKVKIMGVFGEQPFLQAEPPAYLSLKKKYIITFQPLGYLLPFGLILIVTGIIISLWGTKGSKRKTQRFRKKR